MTFRDDAVLDAMAGFEVCKLDIDEPANRDACSRFYSRGGIPEFAVLADDGREVHRWSGAVPAPTFRDELARALRQAVPPDPADPIAVAVFHCERGEGAAVAAQLDVLGKRGAAGDAAEVDRIALLLCTKLAERRRWPELAKAAQQYLDRLPAGVHRAEVTVLQGRATFAIDGTTSAALQACIDEHLASSAAPFPGRSLAERAGALFGAVDPEAERARDAAATAWVTRVNAAMHALAELGSPAVPALRRVLLEGEPIAAQHAATTLGWMRLPDNEKFLRDQIEHGALDAVHRAEVVRSLAMHKDTDCLPLFVDLAGENSPPLVRTEAIDGIRGLCTQLGGTADARVADVLSAALRSPQRNVRAATLQAMFEVRAPLSLPALVAALRDRRELFAEFRICDNALWIFTHQIGQNVLIDGKVTDACTPEIAEFLADWYARNEARLHWDAGACQWTVEGR